MPPPPITLDNGLRLVVSNGLAGSKRALLIGDTVHLSPAMYELMSHAEGEELMRLLKAIEVIEMPRCAVGKFDALPMTLYANVSTRVETAGAGR